MRTLLVSLVALFLGACATTQPDGSGGTTQPPLTASQIAQRVCPSIQTTLTNLQALQGLTADTVETLQKGQQIVTVMCAPGAVPTKLDLETIINKGGPLAVQIISSSNLSDQEKNRMILSVTMIQVMAQGFLQAQAALAQ